MGKFSFQCKLYLHLAAPQQEKLELIMLAVKLHLMDGKVALSALTMVHEAH